MKTILIIVYLLAGQFPAELRIELPDMNTCLQLKEYLEASLSPELQSTLDCVTERTA